MTTRILGVLLLLFAAAGPAAAFKEGGWFPQKGSSGSGQAARQQVMQRRLAEEHGKLAATQRQAAKRWRQAQQRRVQTNSARFTSQVSPSSNKVQKIEPPKRQTLAELFHGSAGRSSDVSTARALLLRGVRNVRTPTFGWKRYAEEARSTGGAGADVQPGGSLFAFNQ